MESFRRGDKMKLFKNENLTYLQRLFLRRLKFWLHKLSGIPRMNSPEEVIPQIIGEKPQETK